MHVEILATDLFFLISFLLFMFWGTESMGSVIWQLVSNDYAVVSNMNGNRLSNVIRMFYL